MRDRDEHTCRTPLPSGLQGGSLEGGARSGVGRVGGGTPAPPLRVPPARGTTGRLAVGPGVARGVGLSNLACISGFQPDSTAGGTGAQEQTLLSRP
eukprot:348373-Hanusia_phi.AAC.1